MMRTLSPFPPALSAFFLLLALTLPSSLPAQTAARPLRMAVLRAEISEEGTPRPTQARVMTDLVANGFRANRRVEIVDWANLADVTRFYAEMQQTRSPEEYAHQLGRLIGVEQVVLISAARDSSGWMVSLKVLDVATGGQVNGRVQVRQADLDRTLQTMVAELNRDPTFGVSRQAEAPLPPEVERALLRAQALADAGQTARAVTELDRLTTRTPVAAETLRRSAQIYLRLGQREKAVERLNAWLDKADPSDPRYNELLELSVRIETETEQQSQWRVQAEQALASARAGLARVRGEGDARRAGALAGAGLEEMSRFATQPAFAGLSEEQRREWEGIRAGLEERAGGQPRVVDLGGNVRMELLPVAAGSFRMGSASGGNNDERPVREVRITRDYWMGKTEVTQGQWQALMGNNPSRFRGDNLPVEQVSWEEAVDYCRRLTERERAAGRLPAGYVYRLPTEAEWEYAARGGAQGRNTTYAGSDNLGQVGWFTDNSGSQTRPVAGKAANELGLHDMSGNEWEWCHDWYQGSYSGLGTVDPVGPASGSYRVFRGGSWNLSAAYCRVAFRGWGRPSRRLGFRVVLAPQLQ